MVPFRSPQRPSSASRRRLVFASLALGALPSIGAAAPLAPQSASEAFHRAYYLEHEKGDLDAAMELYQAAVDSGALSAKERAEIQAHLRACAEELAMADLAQLVPAETILYAELNDPGAQLEGLMEQLGLLQGGKNAGQIAVSPHLIRGVLGLKGAAVAVTRIDPTAGMPGGVAILHPGDMEAVRGLIETALPAGGQMTEPISGLPTYLVEGIVHVTMGKRLIVASTERHLIADVMRRVSGDRSDSLAHNEELGSALDGHRDDLLYFCGNAEPILPLLDGALGALSGADPEAAMAIQLLDPTSLRTVSGGIALNGDGFALHAGLALDEEHRSTAFNLLRMPHVSKSTFNLVPNGAAAFMAASLNERTEGSAGVTNAKGEPVVTIMDIGREIFGNLVDVAVFTLPSASEGPQGGVMLDAALAMSVNDPERSKAIWRLGLGLAQSASGSRGSLQARTRQVSGHAVESFEIEGLEIFLCSEGRHLILSPSLHAIEAALGAADGNHLRQDPMFAGLAQEALEDRTSVLGVSVGRIAALARQILPADELAEAGPVLDLLEDTSLISATQHSDTELRWSAKLTGLPNVAPLVERLVEAELRGGAPLRGATVHGMLSEAAAPARGQGLALAVTEPKANATTRSHFEALVREGNTEAAAALAPLVAAEFMGRPMDANDFVWGLVSSDPEAELAHALLPLIESAAEATDEENWYILDTMAHVHWASGNTSAAIQTARQAVEVARDQDDPRGNEAAAALARFVKAAKQEMLR